LKVSEYSLKEKYNKILDLDESIRIVSRIKNLHVVVFVRKKDSESLIDEEMGNLAHYRASVKANMEEMFDSQLGKIN